jgi:hypothetical protein
MRNEEKRIRCLERRMKFLLNRTDNGKNRALSYDCEEVSALKWAIGVLGGMFGVKSREPGQVRE